jgi:hypothetical protein
MVQLGDKSGSYFVHGPKLNGERSSRTFRPAFFMEKVYETKDSGTGSVSGYDCPGKGLCRLS